MKKYFFLIALSLLSFSLRAQDSSYARYTINNLASERMHGRAASYRGDSVAASFIRNELRHYGVQSLGSNYYQSFSSNTHSMEGRCAIVVNGKELKPYEEFRVAPFSSGVTIALGETPVVRVPAETLIDTDAMKAFLKQHSRELKEAVIYIDFTAFVPSDNMKERYASACSQLRRRNPFGSRVLIVGLKSLNTQGFGLADREHDYAFVEILASSMPKKVKDINIYIPNKYCPNYRTQNVCGMIQGRNDSIIIVGAHYDHIGQMGDNVIFPGAHDNASGVAAVLELARNAAQDTPAYTMVFLFFSGEEAGLVGSKYYSEHPLVPWDKVRLMMNIDMFCGGDEGLMVFNADDSLTKPFVDRLERLNDALQVIPEIRHRPNSSNSDHYYFSQHCPALFFLTMGGKFGGYHDPYDSSEACSLSNFDNYLTILSALTL